MIYLFLHLVYCTSNTKEVEAVVYMNGIVCRNFANICILSVKKKICTPTVDDGLYPDSICAVGYRKRTRSCTYVGCVGYKYGLYHVALAMVVCLAGKDQSLVSPALLVDDVVRDVCLVRCLV